MGAVEDTRKALQDFLAPEIRTITARLDSLSEEQARLRVEISASETRLRGEITGIETRSHASLLASEGRVTAAIDRLRADMPLLVRNAVYWNPCLLKSSACLTRFRSRHISLPPTAA